MKSPYLKVEEQAEAVAVNAGGLLRSKYGLWTLGLVSFLESALPVPLVTDPFLVAYILADKKAALKGTVVALGASVLGGVFAYFIAFSFYEFIANKYLVGNIGVQFNIIVDELRQGTFAVTLLGSVTPIPYTLVAMAAGFIKGNFFLFILASLVGRGGRYALVAVLTYHFGEQAMAMIKKHMFVFTLSTLLVVGLYLILKYN